MTDTAERLLSASGLAESAEPLPLVPADGLAPGVLLWRSLVGALRDDDIEHFIIRNRHRILSDATQVGVDRRGLETQVRLHLPSCNREDLWRGRDSELYEKVRLPAVTRSSAIKEAAEEAEFHAYASFLLGGDVVRRDQSITRADGLRRRLLFRYVLPSVGQFYQTKLHYLRSARCDTSLELGMYLEGARYPLTYLSFSVCDRPYVISALRDVGIHASRSEILVLTRMYGLPGVPRNMMSLCISRAARMVRQLSSFRYIVTAFNPMLGFSGTLFLASGFVPFATAPVTYSYNTKGMFCTRRQSGACLTQKLDTPNNVLSVLGVDKVTRRSLRCATSSLLLVRGISEISATDYAMNTYTAIPHDMPIPGDTVWLQRLWEYRCLLEGAWSAETIHPGYTTEDGPKTPSRGQCGVTSVWVARELRRKYSVEATYCYGTLTIDRAQRSIVDHHCWLEIGQCEDPQRIVIDLTCDQAEGLEGPVLCERHDRLIESGVRYEARSRLSVDELHMDRVWRRFQALRAAVDAVQGEDCSEDATLLGVG